MVIGQWSLERVLCLAFTSLPSIFEQGEEVAFGVGVLLDLFDVQVDSEAGFVGDVDVAVFDFVVMAGEEVFFPFDVEFVEDFLDEVIGCAGGDLHTEGGADRALRVVRGDDAVVGVDHIADVSTGPEAAAGEGFGLEDLDDVVFEEFGEFVFGVEALSGGDGDGRGACDFDEGVDLVVRCGLLEPGGVVGFHLARELERGGRAEATVAFYENVDAWPDGVAHGGDDIDREGFVVVVSDLVGGAEGVEFEGVVASIDNAFCELMEVLGCAVAAIPSVGVGFDLLPDLTTQELPAGDSERFPYDVPAGDFDRRDGVFVDLASVAINVSVHLLNDPFDLKRIHSHIHRFEFVYGRFDGFGERVDGALTHAGYAFVGMDLREEPVFPGVSGDERFNVGDLHSSSKAWSGKRVSY